jgi:hypothetical protein
MCFCRHGATLHRRGEDGRERCAGGGCKCFGFVEPPPAGICACGHWAVAHDHTMNCGLCPCNALRHIPRIPTAQLQELKRNIHLTTVIFPVGVLSGEVDPVELFQRLPGDITVNSEIVLIARDDGLYFVAKHPDREQIAGVYVTEEIEKELQESLVALREHLR